MVSPLQKQIVNIRGDLHVFFEVHEIKNAMCSIQTDHDTLHPLMPRVFSHPYQLDESISNFRVVGWYFSFLFKF